MKVKLVSESTFTVKEHGVHTAFLQTKKMLEAQGVEVVVNSFEKADITHAHTIGPYSLTHMIRDKKKVASAHVIPESFEGSLILTDYWLSAGKTYLRYFYDKADLVLAVAPKVKESLEKLGVNTKVEVFPNPIDVKNFKKNEDIRKKIREKHNFLQKDFIVLSVGQVQSRKGVLDFMEAAKKLPKIKFVWVGGKPFGKLTKTDKELETKLKSPLQNVLFVGSIKVKEMPEYYNLADIFFMHSYQENAPMAILEAGATSLPLVLRNLPEYKMLYKEGYLSLEEDDFVNIISKLKENDGYRGKFSQSALGLAKRFSFEVLGPKLVKFYIEVISS
jgi:1,2-diacylglycerol-3-alpha-glucose alpha-1,2-galactosyltransferase